MKATRNAASIVSIFWSKVDKSAGPDACWPWTGAINKVTGYGVFHPPRARTEFPQTISAHRFAASMAGIVDLGDPTQQVDHTCHNGAGCAPGPCIHRPCCNTMHHQKTELSENVNRSHNANWRKTFCPRGHEYTADNTRTQERGNTVSRSCKTCARDADRAPNRRRETHVR
jgi:hypothetical protein